MILIWKSQKGELTQMFFGSCYANFGVRSFWKNSLSCQPKPQQRYAKGWQWLY
jgi:peptide subunit release factor RF-3